MLKFIGAVAVIFGLCVGVGVLTKNISVSTKASITAQGQQNIKAARAKVADEIRGK